PDDDARLVRATTARGVPAVAALLSATGRSVGAEIGALHVWVLAQLLGVVSKRDLSCLHHVAAACHVQRHQSVLLYKQDRNSPGVDLADDLEDPLDEDRRQAHRRLVE